MRKFLLCLCVLWSAPAIAVTTNWYVDDEIYQTTTCESGANVTPPNAPAKHGYTFVGWYDADVTVGSWFRIGTPSPENPIYPTFYQDGDLILRAIGRGANTVADTYNTTTGQITRRVGVKVLDGTETWEYNSSVAGYRMDLNNFVQDAGGYSTHFRVLSSHSPGVVSIRIAYGIRVQAVVNDYPTAQAWKQWLADQYAAGTPVTVYYPLATPSVETYTPSSP